MDIPELVSHTRPLDDVRLSSFVKQQALSVDTVHKLKQYSAQFYLTDPHAALDIADEAYRIATCIGEEPLGLWIRANALVYLDRYSDASALYEVARAAYLRRGNKLDSARVSVGYVFTLAYTGHPESALAVAEEIQPILQKSGELDSSDLDRLHLLWLNVGVAYEVLGRFEECLITYGRLRAVAEEQDDPVLLAQALHNQAAARLQLNQLDRALEEFLQAESLFVASGDTADLARLYTNILAVLAGLERFDEVHHLYPRARNILAELNVPQEEHRLNLLYHLVIMEGEESAGISTLEDLVAAVENFHTVGAEIDEGLGRYALGVYYAQADKMDEAATNFDQALELALSGDNRTLTWQAIYGLGTVAHKQGHVKEAILRLESATARIESMRYSLRIEAYRSSYLIDKLKVYRTLTALYLAGGNVVQAFQTVERAKSRAIADRLSFRLQTELSQLHQDADQAVQCLADQLQSALERLDSAVWSGATQVAE